MKPLDKIARGPTGIQRQIALRVGDEIRVYAKTRNSDGERYVVTALGPAAKAVKKSRAKNPEAYRAYQRDYMRKRRAKPSP